jgi:menaquinone-dependent protoporphyrinogen oxidase
LDHLSQVLSFLEEHHGVSFDSPRGEFFRRGKRPAGFVNCGVDRGAGLVRLDSGSGGSLEIAFTTLTDAIGAIEKADGLRIGAGSGDADGEPSLAATLRKQHIWRGGNRPGSIPTAIIADILVLAGVAEFVWITTTAGREVQGIRPAREGPAAEKTENDGRIRLISSVLATDIAARSGPVGAAETRRPDSVLVAYATRHGSTAGVAEAIATVLRKEGMYAEILPVDQVTGLAAYRAVIIGSPLYGRKLLPEVVAFARERRQELARVPVAAFVVGYSLAGEDENARPAADHAVESLRAYLDLRDVGFFAGRLDAEKLSLPRRLIFRLLGAPCADRRDWRQIHRWAATLARLCREPA